MGGEAARTFVAIITAIIGLAIISVVLSGRAKTLGLVQNISVGLADDIEAADAPVSGSSPSSLSFAT